MERRGGSSGGTLAILVVLMVANCVSGQSIYACWGGCYNQCFLSSGGVQAERIPCYYLCLNSCVPRSDSDNQYYCQIGCSLELCVPVSYDGASMERCFGRCSNLCNV
ncbi:Uncharacterized protein Adt_13902 [Abeliophyllum distichum]|uniref:Acidic protein n=1 Tax=Abeliophyllum distichum TaxID=126358 RepID=A0ABD1TZ15_9LAMI